MAELAAVTTLAKDGIDTACQMVKLYHEIVNMKIPWHTFNEAMKELKESQKQYSDKAAELVGSIQTRLLNSADEYNSSKEEVSRWCKAAVPLLHQIMALCASASDKDVAEAQKMLLVTVLNNGRQHVASAMQKLEKSRQSFNTAYGELTKLKTQLDNDFGEKSTFFNKAMSRVRAEAYGGAAAGVVFFGPIGLAISYSIATGVVEGHMIPNLKRAFKETQQRFDELQNVVKVSQESIESAKASITKEIQILGTLSAKIDESESFAEMWAKIPVLGFAQLKKSTTELIGMCNEYVSVTQKLS